MGVWRWICAAAIALLLGHLGAAPAAAHPLGNFTVNHHSTLLVGREQIVVEQLLDMAEIPAYQERAAMDRDGDATPSAAEADAYRQSRCAALLPDLDLRVAARPAPLRLDASAISFPPGQGGLTTLRLSCRFLAEARIAGPVAISFADHSDDARLGWREIVVRGEAVAVAGAPSASVSAELTSYPDDLLTSPLDIREVRFDARPAAGLAAAPEAASTLPALAGQDRLAELLALRELTPLSVALALALAFVWGAAHALAPGHGKTVVAAYLVGSRGTVRHALFLGLTTTITHTAGVFALGLITLFASRYILPEQLFPWLSLASGLLVAWLGIAMFAGRLRGAGHHHAHDHSHDHDFGHDHSHPHPHSHTPPQGAMSWRGLLALGVSGGLLPCPSALVVLLGAIALGRVGFGLALVLAFSLGLAGLLTAIGVAFLYAGRLVSRVRVGGPLLRILPAASAFCVALLGLGMTWRALAEVGLLR